MIPLSVTDLFTFGIGPSSSHTVGPMRAAYGFATMLVEEGLHPERVLCDLYGSLSLTGRGHATDVAVLVGLSGGTPEEVDPDAVADIVATIHAEHALELGGVRRIGFDPGRDLIFNPGFLPGHPNAMAFTAVLGDGSRIVRRYYSIGGCAIRGEGEAPPRINLTLPHPFASGNDLLALCTETHQSIAEIVAANESAWWPEGETHAFLDAVRTAMLGSIDRGCAGSGALPGGLRVQRRARAIREKLLERGPRADPGVVFEWVSLWALAVNEENAAGGRVVTAPTNGAAGVIPACTRSNTKAAAPRTPMLACPTRVCRICVTRMACSPAGSATTWRTRRSRSRSSSMRGLSPRC